MGVRTDIQIKFQEIEDKHGRIMKSMFVISHWLLEASRFEHISKKLGNKDTLNYIWEHRNFAIEEMLKTNLFDIKIHKPDEDRGLWLYVLHIKKEGMEVNLTVPYPRYKQIIDIHHSELEETDCNRDKIYLNNKKCRYGKRFKLGFIVENIDKSTNKLIEKIQEESFE